MRTCWRRRPTRFPGEFLLGGRDHRRHDHRGVAVGAAADPDSWTAQWGTNDLREQLAAVSGDVDAHVAVLAEDLRGAHRYGEIVKVPSAAGRRDDAEQWAREGLAEHPSGFQTDRLRDQLVDLLLDDGRGADAVAVCREIYERRAIYQDYLKLRHAAQLAGQWADLSGWALGLLRDRARADERYVTELISVLVREDLLDEAWAAAMASPGQVPESQWFQLIELREQDHPADVIRRYQDLIELGLERASDKYRYPKAVKTIRQLRDTCHRADDEAGFTAYLADLRQRHRRKTSFIIKLDKALAFLGPR